MSKSYAKNIYILFILLIAVLTTFYKPQIAESKSSNRLFISAGEVPLTLQAPSHMCFIDQTSPLHAPVYSAFKDLIEKKSDEILLAVFTDCEYLGEENGVPRTNDILLNSGMVIWAAPELGQDLPADRKKYLNLREQSLKKYTEHKLARAVNQTIDDKIKRTENSLLIGVSGTYETLYKNKKTSTVLSTTIIKNIAMEIIIRDTGHDYITLSDLYDMAENFINMQIILNE